MVTHTPPMQPQLSGTGERSETIWLHIVSQSKQLSDSAWLSAEFVRENRKKVVTEKHFRFEPRCCCLLAPARRSFACRSATPPVCLYTGVDSLPLVTCCACCHPKSHIKMFRYDLLLLFGLQGQLLLLYFKNNRASSSIYYIMVISPYVIESIGFGLVLTPQL